MEEAVLRIVDDLCEEDEASESPMYCTSAECRMDAACFVLNRIPQRYVSSQRGQAHTELALAQDAQFFADMVALAHEGLRRVSTVRRSFYGEEHTYVRSVTGPHFYLPTIKGRLFDGTTFELISDVEIQLLQNGRLVTMIDSRWQNPYPIVVNTAGTYLFWPEPVPAEREGIDGSFEYEIRVESTWYEPFRHFFAVARTSVDQIPDALETGGERRLPDLYLVPTFD